MKMFKGFNDKLQCTPDGKCFQYEVGKTYEEPEADLCHTGFHACEAPLDVFNHYRPARGRFCEVDLDGVSNEHDSEDTKRVGKKITIKAEIGIPGLVKAQIEYVKAHTNYEHTDPKQATAGNYGAATAGESGAATAGESGAATARGTVSVGENGVGLVRGNGVKAKGGIGAILVICEENNSDYGIKEWKAVEVDGEKIKPDTFYRLESGKIVEVNKDD